MKQKEPTTLYLLFNISSNMSWRVQKMNSMRKLTAKRPKLRKSLFKGDSKLKKSQRIWMMSEKREDSSIRKEWRKIKTKLRVSCLLRRTQWGTVKVKRSASEEWEIKYGQSKRIIVHIERAIEVGKRWTKLENQWTEEIHWCWVKFSKKV
jgi:hypothetical protein